MKKTIQILILLLISIFIIGCSKDEKTEETKNVTDESKETLAVSEETDNQFETEDTTEEISETEETNNISSGKAEEYISFDKNMRYHFEGEGNEYASFDVYVDYTTDDIIQFRVDNGGSQLVEVVRKNDNNLSKNLSRGEVYYRENLTSKEDSNKDIILMDPISKGTSWTTSENESRIITDVEVEISTPIGTFDTVEVTTKGDYANTKEYYAKEVGLVKRIYIQDDEEIISTLSKIEKNMPYVQTVRFFYPDDNMEGIIYKDKEISFNTNDITKMILEKEYKNLENDNVSRVLPANAKILSLYLHDDNSVYIDFSIELINEMSAGSGYESLILQSIVNTFGNYYGVEDVYLTVENNPYESGHILLKKGQKLKVDFDNAIE